MSIIKAIIDEAQRECTDCEGLGYTHPTSTRATGESRPRLHCYNCHGNGKVLTDMGNLLAQTLLPALAPHFAERDHTHSVY